MLGIVKTYFSFFAIKLYFCTLFQFSSHAKYALTEIIIFDLEVSGCLSLHSSRVYLGKTCGSVIRARLAWLSPPRLLPRKSIIIEIEFGACLELG